MVFTLEVAIGKYFGRVQLRWWWWLNIGLGRRQSPRRAYLSQHFLYISVKQIFSGRDGRIRCISGMHFSKMATGIVPHYVTPFVDSWPILICSAVHKLW